MQKLSTVFPNEETFQKIYEECLEDKPCVALSVTDCYKAMGSAFDEYLGATQKHMFRFAYQCGYEAAMKAERR